jgi:hypothetical protein
MALVNGEGSDCRCSTEVEIEGEDPLIARKKDSACIEVEFATSTQEIEPFEQMDIAAG